MIVFPNAKINLGLQVKAKRPDGYHNLETVFYPVKCCDILEAVRSDQFHFSSSGSHIDADHNSNLCIKAWKLFQQQFDLPPVKMHLHKIIPMGAGLGGGSADGAFTLILLNKLFGLSLSTDQLIGYALELGSDCPFFIHNKPVFATGRGEIMEPVNIPVLSGKTLVLVNPGVHISTSQAFGNLKFIPHAASLQTVIEKPIEEWTGLLENDFEPGAVKLYPEIARIKEILYQLGAVYAGMTGTGSTFFGIFNQVPPDLEKHFPAHYKCFTETSS